MQLPFDIGHSIAGFIQSLLYVLLNEWDSDGCLIPVFAAPALDKGHPVVADLVSRVARAIAGDLSSSW